MPLNGALSHIDISVGYPQKSIPFYHVLLTSLGFKRWTVDMPGFTGDNPERAAWSVKYPGGATFGIECRPAKKSLRDKRYNRYQPGTHHIALHAKTVETVDEVHKKMVAIGAVVLDPPTDYSGQKGYGQGYYAVFFEDPDGQKVEVVALPSSNP